MSASRAPAGRRPALLPSPPSLLVLGLAGALALLLAACGGNESTLSPAGRGAESIARLWWWMAGGALVIWTLVVGLAVYAIRLRGEKHPHRTAQWLILGGGAVFPTIVLAGLLFYGLSLMPELLEPAPEGSLQIEVEGRQWWWRVRYPSQQQGAVELANEIRLPVGRRVQLVLSSTDVIHSFWVPALTGKMDMIPGRVTRLAVEPTRTGVFRGTCAEYCGTSHALMAFYAVVQEEADFEAWLRGQAAPAREPDVPLARRGARLFRVHGCGACHAVRGTVADGAVGPDLTHVASRVRLGAGLLPTGRDAFRRWIEDTETIKPGVHMPSFGMLPEEDVAALAAYLEGLE